MANLLLAKSSIAVPEGKMKFLREQGYVGKEIILGIVLKISMMNLCLLKHLPVTKITANIDVAELTGAEMMIYTTIAGQDFVARLDSRVTDLNQVIKST